MAENVEFVNSYIERLNKTVHDLTGRNVVLETRLEMSEKVISQLNVELEQAKQELAARSKQIDQVRDESKRFGREITALRQQLDQSQKELQVAMAGPVQAVEEPEDIIDYQDEPVEDETGPEPDPEAEQDDF